VALLNRIFSRLDDLAVARGLEKIKTVGDAYMIAGGLPEPRPGHLEAMADLALEMTTVIRSEHGLDLRIGLHCGPAIAGVIGRRKLFYDVWGDTINVASRLESHGVPGRVHVSSDVRARLEPAFVLEERGPIELKGRGRMVTHFVVARR
jgi:class 3 adenylate cyclase